MINLSCNGGQTLPVTMNISKLCTVRARCVQLPLWWRSLSVNCWNYRGGGGIPVGGRGCVLADVRRAGRVSCVQVGT